MSLAIIFILIFSIMLIILNLKNKYHIFFMLMMVGMALAMATIIVDISKISNYILPSRYIFRNVESVLYTTIKRLLRIPLSSLLIMRNCGIVTYLVANIFFVVSFNNSIRNDSMKHPYRRKKWRLVLLALFPLAYFIFYHPYTAYWIYIIGKTSATTARQTLWYSFLSVFDIIILICSILYLIYPIVYLVSNYLKNRITFFSEQLLGLAVSLALLNTTFFCMFFIGIFSFSVKTVFKDVIWHYNFGELIPEFYIVYLPFVMCIILSVVLFIVIRFKVADIINSFKARTIKKNLNSMYQNQRDVLHSLKNLLLRIEILSEEALKSGTIEECIKNIDAIRAICIDNMNIISKTMEYIKIQTIHALSNNFIDAVESALKTVPIPDDVTVVKNYQRPEIYLNFDMYHITQSIVNLIYNSVDAMEKIPNGDKNITITVYDSNNWVYFSVADTGCGIPRKLLNKVYSPYTTTKLKPNNWGLGLTYVFQIIKAHYGHIRFRSKAGKGTVVEILLPRSSP